MNLRDYFKKRTFSKTPEPAPAEKKPDKNGLIFVVQEHHASRLHYDFRLEIDGVLKSWAVPKGPSLNPHDHRLAVQTEDHPYDYRRFEGVIPKGNYGAGEVIIWDEGQLAARQGKAEDSEKTLRRELKKGHLTFMLHGQKLRGEFALIKMQNSKDENAWLLVKKDDEFASTEDVTKQDESVKSHRRANELAGSSEVPDTEAYPKVAKPWQVKPMLASLTEQPFNREGWLFEVKWDGYRAVGVKHGSRAELYSRNNLDFKAKYPPVFEALHTLKHDAILDGEIVVVDKDGHSHFEWLQNWGREPDVPGTLQYFVFDILWHDGHDLRDMPLIDRKKVLQSVLPANHRVLKFSDHVLEAGKALFKQMQKEDIEGMVAKRAGSSYHEGARSHDWMKVKTKLRQEVVIGGFTEPRGSRTYLGSLLVGVFEKGELRYVGHSGGGIPDDQRATLHKQLQKLERKTSPFSETPKPNAPVHWVNPELVCEMSFSEWTSDGRMRHPQFEGMRIDKKPTAVKREQSEAAPAEAPAVGRVEISHPDKIFFPKHGYTKADMAEYYEGVADYILPYLKDRPCSLLRMPHGINGESFFQKNNPYLPEWVPHADIFSDSNHGTLRWVVGDNLETLLYMVQLGCIEINPWNSRIGNLDKPDWLVIDLDPEGIGFKEVVKVARMVKEVCDEWGVAAWPKTSGKTGLHIYVPLAAHYTFEQAKNFAHLLALEVHRRQEKITSVERMPAKRQGKIYLDFLQNREGQTLAAPYSLRPTPDASVSTPLHWDEVVPSLKPTDFTIKNMRRRLARTGDLWQPVLGNGVKILEVLKKIS